MSFEQINSVQSWLPYNKILDYGILELKDSSYVKILKVYPINYNLKSEFEKKAILNSYENFFKGFNKNIQILIQSKKEDLSKHISNINNQKINENKNILEYSNKYIEFIKTLNQEKKSSSKNFYIILKYKNNDKELEEIEELATEDLNDKYFKIKDCLSRCGNIILDINNKKESKNILFSFLNSRKYLDN